MEQLAELIGHRLAAENRRLFEDGLHKIALAMGLSEGEVAARALSGDRVALREVISTITVGETYFFRHPEHFDILREVILPDVTRARREAGVIRAWSAGCASGEEAYSLAIALRSAVAPHFAVSVLGTDINKSALETARQASYGRWSLRSSMQCLPGYVHHGPDGTVTVAGGAIDTVTVHGRVVPVATGELTPPGPARSG